MWMHVRMAGETEWYLVNTCHTWTS